VSLHAFRACMALREVTLLPGSGCRITQVHPHRSVWVRLTAKVGNSRYKCRTLCLLQAFGPSPNEAFAAKAVDLTALRSPPSLIHVSSPIFASQPCPAPATNTSLLPLPPGLRLTHISCPQIDSVAALLPCVCVAPDVVPVGRTAHFTTFRVRLGGRSVAPLPLCQATYHKLQFPPQPSALLAIFSPPHPSQPYLVPKPHATTRKYYPDNLTFPLFARDVICLAGESQGDRTFNHNLSSPGHPPLPPPNIIYLRQARDSITTIELTSSCSTENSTILHSNLFTFNPKSSFLF
jgi:hypothetical protein